MKSSIRKWLVRSLILLAVVLIFWLTLRKIPLAEIWSAIQRLHGWQAGVILLVNLFIFTCVTLRWWIIVRAEAKQVPFLPLLAVRVSVFGISYFTVGPRVGGEPLQVFSLQRKYGLSFARAVASVLLDKLLEFLIDFILLAIGVTALLQAGLLSEKGFSLDLSWAAMGMLVLIPPVHLLLLHARRRPLTALVRRLPFVRRDWKPLRFLRAAEWLAGSFLRRHPRALAGALGVSFLQAAGMLVDYTLIIHFLGIQLSFWKTIAGWTAGWLSFVIPLPGGLGAMEASQVFALGAFGIPAATALAVALVMRGRDVFIGGVGLLLVRRGWARKTPKSQPAADAVLREQS